MGFHQVFFILMQVTLVSLQKNGSFQLSVIHLNDFHARFEETSLYSTRCTDDNCIGGFARVYSAVNYLKRTQKNSIFLNAGDNFQGTLWYNKHKWNVTQYFLNKLPTDAYTLGNHEFDDGLKGVVPFMEALNAPILVANLDDSREPSIQGLYNKSTVIERDGRRIGIIGVILSSTDQISQTENLAFTDEVEAVNKEAKHLVEKENCNIVIVLSHCGIDVDMKIAREAGPHVSLIVGGHTHTFLYTGENSPGPEKPKGPYPVVVNNRDGRTVLVVQASFNTKYLGNLKVWFDEFGTLIGWGGNPLFLDQTIPQDSNINKEINEWKLSVDEYGDTVLGTSKVLLDQSTRRSGESNIGSFLTDAMVYNYVNLAEKNAWTYSSIAIINSGAIRSSLFPGNITLYDLVSSQPFENTIDCVDLTGKDIKDFLEYSITPSVVRKYQFHEFLQMSGIRVVFDPKKPIGSRVTRLKVLCNKCQTPVYSDLNETEVYRVIMPSFLIQGGDGYTIIRDNIKNRIIGPKDLDVYTSYIKKMSPIIQGHDERIILLDSAEIQDSVEFNQSSSIELSLSSFTIVYAVSVIFCLHVNTFS